MTFRYFAFAGLAFLLLASSGCLDFGEQPPQDDVDISNAVTQEMCDEYGGNWHSGQCRCAGIVGFSCPPGWVCMDLEPEGSADALGTCKKVSN